jgi:hypothetical protein
MVLDIYKAIYPMDVKLAHTSPTNRWAGRKVDHFHIIQTSRKDGATPPVTLHVFMKCCLTIGSGLSPYLLDLREHNRDI